MPCVKLSVEEYFKLDKNSEIRHEYYQGEIFGMAGVSKKHNIIAFNCVSALKNALKRKQSVKLALIISDYSY